MNVAEFVKTLVKPTPMAAVEFVPQAWINDYAERADCEGPNTFEVEKHLLDKLVPDSNESDALKDHKNAPKWIKNWSGPFYFTWEIE
jgi:hypothetical protein